MKKSWSFSFVVLLFANAALALNEVETTAATRITPANAFAYYNTTGITIGSYLYVYHQGGGQPGEDNSCTGGDKIIAYRALITNGVPGTFERVGRISPCVFSPTTDPGHPQHPNPPASYGPGQIFRATLGGVTKYHLLADVSDTISFFNVWRAESSDGINWKWYISQDINNAQFNGRRETIRDSADVVSHTIDIVVQPQSFIHATSGVYMLNPILLSTGALTNNAQWWGFFNFWNGTGRVGELLVDWDSSGTVPTVSVVSNVSGGTYSFHVLPQNGGAGGSSTLDIVPYALRSDVNVKTLLYDPTVASYQLWGGANLGPYDANVNCDTTKRLVCNTAGGCATGDGSGCPFGQSCNVFLRNTGIAGEAIQGSGSGFLWWAVTRFSFGGDNGVYSQTRYLPSGYELARAFPFRWNSPTGRRFLFSATNDANICSQFLFSGFFKMYIVKTELAYQ